MAQAKHGDTVKVHYTGKLEDGTVFDTSKKRPPIRFKIGTGQVISGFEEAITGMNVGETKTVTIPVDKAYGPRRDDMIITMGREKLPFEEEPKIGQRLELTQSDNSTMLVTVTGLSALTITLDANHPLAGKNLTFELELVDVV